MQSPTGVVLFVGKNIVARPAAHAAHAMMWLIACVASGCDATESNPLPEGYVAALTAAQKPVAAGDWPRFLGPNGTGVSTDTNWTTEWPAEGPKKVWTAKVGTGFSGIAIAGGRAFTMGNEDDRDTVFALDAATGKELWKHSYDCKLVPNLYEGGPNATPTVDGERVFTFSKEGHLFALGAGTGKVLWQLEVQKDFDAKMPAWGFSSSPLVLDDKVLVDAGVVVALDKTSGKVVWKTKDVFKPGYGTIASFKHEGRMLLALLNNEFLLLLDAKDGSEVARQAWTTSFDTSACTPTILGDTIYISTGYGKGCALLKMKPADAGKLDLEVVYENRKLRNHFNNSILYEGALYGFDGQSNQSRNVKLICMDYQTGDVKWEQRGLGCGSLIVAGGKLVILGDEGLLTIAEAKSDAYKEIAKAQVLEGKCWTAPTLCNAKIYCRNAAGDVVCLDVAK